MAAVFEEDVDVVADAMIELERESRSAAQRLPFEAAVIPTMDSVTTVSLAAL